MNVIKLFIILTASIIIAACGDSDLNTSKNKSADSDSQSSLYTCAMHPHYISNDADGTCPICGMDLVPVNDDEAEEHNYINVSAEMIQIMGVRTSPVAVMDFSRTLRAFGTVEANERLENVSVSRIEGWIEQLNINAEGDTVNKGDLLYKVYSPDLLSAQRDYLSALNSASKERLQSVTQRLRSTGLQDQALAQLKRERKIIEQVPVYAESDGIVAELLVRKGGYIKPGDLILRLQSYRNVWVIASVPETDLSSIQNGMNARLRFPSAPQGPSEGAVDIIYPTIDPNTRTAKVRIEVDNFQGLLLPGAYADISFRFASRPRLSIVSEALLRDSRGSHVIVALGEGRFTSRVVATGISVDGRTEILNGLVPGELVVASAQFMLDSEVNLREGLSKFSQGKKTAISNASLSTADTASKNSPISELNMSAASLAQLNHFVDAALYLHEVLTSGTEFEPNFLSPAIALTEPLMSEFNNAELTDLLTLSQRALLNAKASTNNSQLKNELAKLNTALLPWLLTGAPKHYARLGLGVYRDNASAQVWVQNSHKIVNPYTLDNDNGAHVYQWSRQQWGPYVDENTHVNTSLRSIHE